LLAPPGAGVDPQATTVRVLAATAAARAAARNLPDMEILLVYVVGMGG
jgi:hypothetical protein